MIEVGLLLTRCGVRKVDWKVHKIFSPLRRVFDFTRRVVMISSRIDSRATRLGHQFEFQVLFFSFFFYYFFVRPTNILRENATRILLDSELWICIGVTTVYFFFFFLFFSRQYTRSRVCVSGSELNLVDAFGRCLTIFDNFLYWNVSRENPIKIATPTK